MNNLNRLLLACLFATLLACGGGGGSDEGNLFDSGGAGSGSLPLSGNLTVSISGLSGSLLLTLNNELLPTISTSGTISSPVTFNAGDPYQLRVFNQPDGLDCTVTNGSGLHPGTAVNINVNCISRASKSYSGDAFWFNTPGESRVITSIRINDFSSFAPVEGFTGSDLQVKVDGSELGEVTNHLDPLVNVAFNSTPIINIQYSNYQY